MKFNDPWGGSWPAFNVADVLVVVGGFGLAALVLLRRDVDRGQRDPIDAPLPHPWLPDLPPTRVAAEG